MQPRHTRCALVLLCYFCRSGPCLAHVKSWEGCDWLLREEDRAGVRAHFGRKGGAAPAPDAASRGLHLVASLERLCALTVEAVESQVAELRSASKNTPVVQGQGRAPNGTSPLPRVKASFTPDGRFPALGTAEYDGLCAHSRLGGAGEAAGRRVFEVDAPAKTEGLAAFVAQIAQAGIHIANDGNSTLHLKWPGVTLTDAFVPAGPVDWTASSAGNESEGTCTNMRDVGLGVPHINIRSAYSSRAAKNSTSGGGNITWDRFLEPACVLNAILAVSPKLAGGHPRFGQLQKAMSAKDTLAIGIYVRLDDGETYRPLPERSSWPLHNRYRYYAPILCALQLERRWAAGFSRVMWYVASNSGALRKSIVREFDESAGGGRKVAATDTRGHHTNSQGGRRPRGVALSYAVSESVVDWWLLGEVDVAVYGHRLVGHGGSFAATAWTRTARIHSVFEPTKFGALSTGPDGVPRASVTDCGDDDDYLSMTTMRPPGYF